MRDSNVICDQFDSKRRPVSPGPESRYLGSLENLTEEPNNGHGGIRRTASLNRGGVLEESGNYNGSLRPVSARKPTTMFQPSWRKESPDAGKTAGEKRPQSPHWQSFTEAAFGTACPPVTGEVDSNLAAGQEECPPTIASGTTHSVRAPSHSPIRMRNFSTDSLDNSRANVSPSGNSTHVDRLARSGSAASLAVVMASTFPNGGNANFDLEGTAAKISEVCKSLTNSQSDIAACGTVHLTRSRSMNSVNLVASPDLKRSNRPQIYLDKNTSNKLKIRSATTPERRVVEPMKATKPAPSFKEIKDLQEKLKEATTISYTDLITCPRHRLPAHIDKLRLQDYLSDTEFTDVFKITREQFKRLAVWKQTQLKKEALLF